LVSGSYFGFVIEDDLMPIAGIGLMVSTGHLTLLRWLRRFPNRVALILSIGITHCSHRVAFGPRRVRLGCPL
jgi:hypothetical protein